MREITATTTKRNQVTIPAEVRHLLGLKPRDKVTFTIENGGRVPFGCGALYLGIGLRLSEPFPEPRRL